MTDTRPPDLLPGLLLDAPAGWLPLAAQPLTVLVGVTGVGKSTALAALGELKLLPDRREVTDAVMIYPQVGRAVSDREQRFALTARYREAHPGGMAQAVGSLSADPQRWSGPLAFDGLRGQGEVKHAAEHFPAWRFVSLHAPDVVRVRRLLQRADSFDAVAAALQGAAANADLRAELAALTGVQAVFAPTELDHLAALSADGYGPADIVAKTRIVISERRNYDPQAARRVLAGLPEWRRLDLDTSLLSAEQVARRVFGWLERR